VLTADQLLLTLWRRKITFLLTLLLTMGAVTVATYTRPKVYAAAAYILVGSTRVASSDYEATQTNQVVLKTYAELLQTRSVSSEVARSLPFGRSPLQVEEAVGVTPIAQSQLIRITAEADDPGRAQVLANAYADVFVQRAGRISIDSGGTISATVADRATLDNRPIRPRPVLYLSIGAFLAALLAAGVAMVRDRLDQQLKIDEAAGQLFGIPILARVTEQNPRALRGLGRFEDDLPDSLLSESFNMLLTNIVFAGLGTTQAKSIAMVSAGQGEGKSTCCLGLARAAASLDLEVLLVDGDLRRRQLSSMLGLIDEEEPGLSEVLSAGAMPWAAQELGATISQGLRALPAGQPVPHPTALLSGSIPAFERKAVQAYSVVIFDTPPVSVGADASLIAAATEEVLLVVNVRSARRSSLEQTIDQLMRVHANVVGVVLNRTNPSSGPQAYYTDQPRERSARRERGEAQ